MKNLIPQNILYKVIDSIDAGFIAVIFTPEIVWDLTDEIAKIHTYEEIGGILEELELFQIQPSLFEHRGLLDIDELNELLYLIGFQKNPLFSVYVETVYSNEISFPDIDIQSLYE